VRDDDALGHVTNDDDLHVTKRNRRNKRRSGGDAKSAPSASVPAARVVGGCVQQGEVAKHELEAALHAKGHPNRTRNDVQRKRSTTTKVLRKVHKRASDEKCSDSVRGEWK